MASAIAIKGLYCENANAIESEAMLSKKNVYSKAGADRRACKERNLRCYVHVAAVNKRKLPPF